MNRRMMKEVVSTNSSSFCASPGSIRKPKLSLLPSTTPNTNTAMKPRGVQAARGEIGADHRDQRHYRRIFGEERPFLMRDQKRGEIAEGEPGGDADRGLLDERKQGMRQRELACAGRDREHA